MTGGGNSMGICRDGGGRVIGGEGENYTFP